LELDKDDGELEDRRNRMNTPRAALHAASKSDGSAGGKLSDLSRDQEDPLRRLEAELQSADGGPPEVERLYEKTWALLEEAWGLMTECLVMRNGLLDACAEIEQTMDAVHRRLEALSTEVEPGVRPIALQHSAASTRDAEHGVNGAVAP
jgi:hypothetical protein